MIFYFWVAENKLNIKARTEKLEKDPERLGTGEKDEKFVNGTQVSTGKFPPGKLDYLFRSSSYSVKFPVERTKKSCSICIPTGISGNFEMENVP